MGGSTVHDGDIQMEDDFLGGGHVGYKLNRYFEVEGVFNTMESPSNRELQGAYIRFDHYGLDLVVNPLPGGVLEPYLAGGYTRLNWDLPDGNHGYNGFEGGGGLRLRLLQGDGWSWHLRADARGVFAKNEELVKPALVDDLQGSLLYTVGFQLGFGSHAKDTDGDGVRDADDRCADTPLGALVDAEGCPIDRDHDGVYDGLDQCPATPRGARVDAHGCPRDSDGDGVYDGLDRCSGTAAGVPVDSHGCPKDSDGDGVHDGIDRCPGTARGVKVDRNGCEVSQMEQEMLDTGMIRLDSIHFESSKAILKAESFASLNEVGELLSKWHDLHIEIGGHTDSQGASKFNQRLSENRAAAVRDYLLQHFNAISASQLQIKGYGESHPIADNGTATGRAHNRRVEFKALNRGVLKK
jgi:OOP family OmpA-OmpF porin